MEINFVFKLISGKWSEGYHSLFLFSNFLSNLLDELKVFPLSLEIKNEMLEIIFGYQSRWSSGLENIFEKGMQSEDV